VGNSGLSASANAADQGKLRVLGIAQSNIDFMNGWNVYAELDSYGGSNLFGVAGKLGTRLRW
jgi:hypothetical protein